MPDIDGDAIKAGLLIGGAALLVLFAGQALSFAARWLGRAVSGAAILLLALGLGYVAYRLYAGWSAAGTDSEQEGDRAWESDLDSELDEVGTAQEEYVDGDLSEEELEAELETLMKDVESGEGKGGGDAVREVE